VSIDGAGTVASISGCHIIRRERRNSPVPAEFCAARRTRSRRQKATDRPVHTPTPQHPRSESSKKSQCRGFIFAGTLHPRSSGAARTRLNICGSSFKLGLQRTKPKALGMNRRQGIITPVGNGLGATLKSIEQEISSSPSRVFCCRTPGTEFPWGSFRGRSSGDRGGGRARIGARIRRNFRFPANEKNAGAPQGAAKSLLVALRLPWLCAQGRSRPRINIFVQGLAPKRHVLTREGERQKMRPLDEPATGIGLLDGDTRSKQI